MQRVPENGPMVLQEEVEAYDRLSKGYLGIVEKKLVCHILGLFHRHSRKKDGFFLDVGTGSAIIPIRLTGQCQSARVVAADLSMNMLAKARTNILSSSRQDRILLVCADSANLPFRDESFDFVFSHSMFHHLPDPSPTLSEIVRVVGKGCGFLVRDLRRPPALLVEWYVRIFGNKYDELMKKMYRESLHAGFSYKEMKKLSSMGHDATVRVKRFFITHLSLEGTRRPAEPK